MENEQKAIKERWYNKSTKKREEEYSSSEEEVENQDDIKEQTIPKSDKTKNLTDQNKKK